jgi:arginine deiminase
MLITVFVFLGIEGASVYSRMARKREDVGRATVIGFLSVLSVFALVTLVSYGVMPQSELAGVSQPAMAAVLESIVGPWGSIFIRVGVIVSVLGAYLAWTLMAAEVLYIPAKTDDMPRFLARTNRHGAPMPALVMAAGLISLLLVALLFAADALDFMLDLTAALSLIPYLLAAAYALKLTATRGRTATANRSSLTWSSPRWHGVHAVLDMGGSDKLLLSCVLYAPGALTSKRAANAVCVCLSRRGGAVRCDCPRGRRGVVSWQLGRSRSAPREGLTMTSPSANYVVHSEVGKLRKVLVCSPGLAHERLTPTNCDELLFDDVLWVQNARRDHFDFMDKMRDRGVEVVELHNLLTETMAIPEAKAWLLDRKIVPNEVGLGLVNDTRGYLDSLEPRRLAELLIGGLSTRELPADIQSGYRALAREAAGITEYLMPPLPNTLYTRDTTCWIYGGLTLNPLFWPARHDETLLMKAIYQFHPDYVGSTVWWGDPELAWGMSTIEGGDVLVPGNGAVLIGMSERTSRQANTPVAARLFEQSAASKVIVAGMPKLRAAMHLDTVFTFADRDVATIYPDIIDGADVRPASQRHHPG